MTSTDTTANGLSLYLIVAFAKFVGVVALLMMPLQIGAFIDGLGINETRAGLLATTEVFSLGAGVLLVSIGAIRLPLNRLAMVGASIAIAANLSTAFADSFTAVAICRGASGLGMGLVNAAATMAIVTCFKDADKAAGRIYALVYVGASFLYLATPYLSEYGEFRGLFIGLAVLFMLFMPVFRLLPTKGPQTVVSEEDELPLPWTPIILLLAGQAALMIGLGTCWSFAERLGLERGYDLTKISYFLAWSNLATVFGAAAAGWWGTKLGRRLPLLGSAIIVPLTCVLMSSPSFGWAYVPGLMGYQFGVSFLLPYLIGTGALMDPKGRVAATVVGSVVFFFGAGAAVGGWVIEQYSLQALGYVAVALGMVALVIFAVLLTPRQIGKFSPNP